MLSSRSLWVHWYRKQKVPAKFGGILNFLICSFDKETNSKENTYKNKSRDSDVWFMYT